LGVQRVLSCGLRGAGEKLPCGSGEIPEGAGPLWGAPCGRRRTVRVLPGAPMIHTAHRS